MRFQLLYEFKGVCHHCAEEQTVLIHNGELMADCPGCGASPFGFRKLGGMVYVVTNTNQKGVKIGSTTKTVEERVKGLSSTGVPGKFIPIAIFAHDKPKDAEKRVHKKLLKYRIEKEHFDLSPLDAVLGAYRALNKRVDPIFYDRGLERRFWLQLEHARTEMQIRLAGGKKA